MGADLVARDAAVFMHQNGSTPVARAVAGAAGVRLRDHDGHHTIDLHGNSCHHLGYGHPALIEAVTAQLAELPFAPRRYTSRWPVELAERLSARWPGGRGRVLFAPSGSDAVEIALKIARLATGRHRTVAFEGSWHGAGFGALSAGGRRSERPESLGPLVPGAVHVPAFHPSPHSGITPDDQAGRTLEALTQAVSPGQVAAVLAEPIRSAPYRPPAWFWPAARELCDRTGTLLIFDEIPTGLGKTGRLFTSEHVGCVPDITVLGKALGGALVPLAAVIARSTLNVAGSLAIGHYTHEKNPLSCRIGCTVLDVIEQQNLVARATEVGDRMRTALHRNLGDCSAIQRVDGIGILTRIDLAVPPEWDGSDRIEDALYRAGVNATCSSAGVISLSPSLVMADGEADAVAAAFGSVLGRRPI